MNRSLGKWSVMLLAGLLGVTSLVNGVAHAQRSERKVLKKVEPIYPTILLERKIGGIVRLKVTVRADGTVREVEVDGGNPILAASATRAVKAWRYSPGDRETTAQVVVHFDPNK